MPSRYDIKESLIASLPIMAGYVGIGLPCGIMEQQAGMDAFQALLLSAIFYSGAGQFMIPSLWLAGTPLAAIIASVSFVNTRQVLYGASLAPFCTNVSKRLAFFFTAGVTDESYGVNIARFCFGNWSVDKALMVNLFCMSTWAVSNAVGVLLGNVIALPVAIGSFAMTSIFICLLCSQHFDFTTVLVVFSSFAGVIVCKLAGLTGPAILIGAGCGVIAGLLKQRWGGAAHDVD